jgi:hypothetical protein
MNLLKTFDRGPFVRVAIALLLLLLALGQRSSAYECRFPTGTTWVSLSLPDIWENDNFLNNWYSGYTPDRTVWISASVFDEVTEERIKNWLPKHLDSFGVFAQFDWATFHSARGRIGDWTVTDFFVTGRTEEGPCEISVFVFEVDETRRFVVTTGGSTANRQKHRQVIKSILASVKRTTPPGGNAQ